MKYRPGIDDYHDFPMWTNLYAICDDMTLSREKRLLIFCIRVKLGLNSALQDSDCLKMSLLVLREQYRMMFD